MLKISKILIIDDDDTICKTLAVTLESEGYQVDTAKTGEEAIAKSYSHFYNLAIVDWRLPDMHGTELLGRLKRDDSENDEDHVNWISIHGRGY